MFNINRKTNLKYIKPLFILASCLAVIPPYDFDNNKISFSLKYKIFRISIILYFVVGFVLTFMDKITYMQPLLHNTVVVVNYLAFISYFLINITTVLSSNFHNFKNLQSLLDIMVSIDKKLFVYHKNKSKKCHTYLKIEMVLGLIVLVSAIVFDCILWNRATFGTLTFSLFYENSQKIHTHVTVQVVCNFIICIRYRYQASNNLLVDVVKKKDITSISSSILPEKFKREYTVKSVIKIIIALNKMIEFINEIYGWTLLCLNVNIIANLLLSFDFIIEYTSEMNVLKEKNGVSFIFLMLIWSLFALSQGVLLASLANSTIYEIQTTSHISYKLLQDVPCDSINPLLQEMREDLILLSQQMSLRAPYFSAAGFFKIDYTMLFALLSSITSYLVVLIQFN